MGKACVLYGVHEEDIDDFLAAQAWPAFRPTGCRGSFPAQRWRG